MLKRSVSLGTSFLVILLASSEGASQATFQSMERLRAISSIQQKVVSLSRVTSNGSHTVASGETLWGISRKYQVNFSELATLNGLAAKNPVIQIGQKLRLPGGKAKAAPAKTKAPTTFRAYQVKNGETFYRIAKKHGVSVSALQKANASADPAALKVGQTLQIPGGKAPASPKAPEIVAEPPVKEVEPTPTPRTRTRMPAPQDRANLAPKGYGIYTAQPGDTTESIAQEYGISREEFLRINQKSSYPNYSPRPGEFLMVPTDGSWYVPTKTLSSPQATTTRSRDPRVAPPANPLRTTASLDRKKMLVQHLVRANDNLEDLAKRFETTTDQIRLDNPGIESNRDLKVGSTLKIRTQSTL